MPEDKMDSSIPQVTLKGSTSDQSAGQGLSSVKKKGKGNDSPAGFIAMLGGLGSFASLLGEVSSEKNAKTFSGIPSTGEVSQAKTKEKWNPEMLRKTQILKGDEITGEDDTANLPKTSCVQEVEALSGGSVPERGKRILLKQGIGALGSAEKASSGDAKLSDGEAGIESAALSTGGVKGNGLARKNAVDGLRGLPDDETEDQRYRHDQNLSKASDVRGSNNGKVSPDPKGQEMLSIKDGTQYSADVKDNVTSIHQIQTQIEKIQSYKNLTSDVLKSEKSQENAPNDIQTGKTGSSLSTAQTDFSMVNGVWSDARTSMNDKTVAPVIFQEVAGQIIDGASNMLAKGSSRIVITLEPPNLGTLNMDVRVQHDMVSMLLTADNHEVKQVLQANLDQLKTALQGQGLNIDRFDVLVHERSYDGSQGFQPGGGTLFDRGRGKGDDTKDDSVRPPVLPSGGSEMNEPSLGIISLFV
jgi:flagellar hook-length control protein FliK